MDLSRRQPYITRNTFSVATKREQWQGDRSCAGQYSARGNSCSTHLREPRRSSSSVDTDPDPDGSRPGERVCKIMNRNSRLVLDTETNNTSIVIRGLVVIFPGGDKCGGVHVG